MNNKLYLILILVFFQLFNKNLNASNVTDHRMAVLVNDQLITTFDIKQRMRMNAILAGINITPENNNQLANTVVDELIIEKLKSEKLIDYEVLVSEDEYINQEINYFINAEFTKEELIEVLQLNNINYSQFKNFLIHEISWQKLISGMYYRVTSASEIEIEEVIMNNPNLSREQANNIIIQKQLDLKSNKMIRDMLNEATIEYK